MSMRGKGEGVCEKLWVFLALWQLTYMCEIKLPCCICWLHRKTYCLNEHTLSCKELV